MAGKPKRKVELVKPVRWQDVELCDRCGGRAHFRAKAPTEGDKREILLCKEHREEHADALKAQNFSVDELTQP